MDGDGQHDPTYLPAIIQKLREGDDMVVNSRYHPRSPRQSAVPLDRELLNVQVTSAVERITEAGFTDPLCGLRGYNAKVVKFLLEQEFATRVCADTYGFVLESLLRVWHNGGFKIVELPHPAIYNGDGKIAEIYGEAHLEERLERFRMHAGHLVRTVRALNLPLKHVIS